MIDVEGKESLHRGWKKTGRYGGIEEIELEGMEAAIKSDRD